MQTGQIRLGIIGAGAAVRNLHYPVMQGMSDEILMVAICNGTRQSAEFFLQSVGSEAQIFDDYNDLLESDGIDAVLISVPIALSARVLTRALTTRKHVMSEKPLAATPKEARQILEVGSGTDKVIAIGENFRYRKDIQKAKHVIEAGEIGRPLSFQLTTRFDIESEVRRVWLERPWRQMATHPGGFVLDAGIHAVSGLREVLGNVRHLYAQVFRQSKMTEGPDNLLMQVTMESGAIGHCFASYTAKVRKDIFFKLSVLGKEGSLELEDGEMSWVRGSLEPGCFRTDGTDRGYKAQWANFVAAIRERERIVSSLDQAYQDLLVIDAAIESAATGKSVSIVSRKCPN